MASFYRRLALIIVLVGGISGGVIYYTIDIHTLRYLTVFQPKSLLLVILLMAVGLYFDGTRLLHLVRIAGQRITLLQAVQVIFSNYFLALLTPGAAGGAVAQVVFLRRAGVPAAVATIVVLIRTLMSILFLFLCLPLIFYFDPGLLPWIAPRVLITASVLIIVCCAAGVLFLRSMASFKLLVLLSKKLKFSGRKRVFSWFRDIRGAVFLMLAAPLGILRVFVETAASLLALYSIIPVLFTGLGITVNWPLVLGRAIFLNILLYFAPTPGGSGIAEGAFVVLFKGVLPQGTVGILAVAWRIFAEYLPFSIGLYFCVKAFGRDLMFNRHSEEDKT